MKVGDGLTVDNEGKLSVDAANTEETTGALNEVFGARTANKPPHNPIAPSLEAAVFLSTIPGASPKLNIFKEDKNMSKFVNLEQIKVLANKVKSEDAALGTKLETVTTKVDNLVAAGGEANILEGVKVNGAALAISDKMVDILIASGEENGTISVNGAAVAIKGLAALAYKSEITEDELGEALKASIAAKATKADLDALTVRVGDIEKAGYQTAEQVQAAIAASGHAHFEVS